MLARVRAAAGCCLSLLLPSCGRADAPPSPLPSPAGVPGASTAPGARDPAAPPLFVEVAATAGLRYRWTIPGTRPYDILQLIGNGAAFLDYNADGDLDVLLVGPRPALFRGDGRGRFTEVTRAAGLAGLTGRFLGCAVGDYDDDGFDDLYLSAHAGGVLLRNRGGRRFAAVTRHAGIAPQPWGSSVTFLDADADGLLDLYIANYVRFGPTTEPRLCNFHGTMTACPPGKYEAERGVLYRNHGHGRFEDVTRRWGLERVSGKALEVAAAPFGPEYQPALAIANDTVAGDLLLLRATGSENRGRASGMAFAADGDPYGGMGIDWGDYDNDGGIDLLIATFQNQAKLVFRNAGGTFVPQDTVRIGMGTSIPYVAFGAKWFDYDNDGWLDVMMTNGHVQDNIAEVDLFNGPAGGALYRQPTLLYRNAGGSQFQDVSARLGAAGSPIVGRGLATGDYDNDGRVDALAVDSEGQPRLLHNVTPNPGSWLLLNLVGRQCNRNALGAVVNVVAGERRLTRHCHSDGSYLSASDRRLHFGLGGARKVERLEVRWPDGRIDLHRNLPVDQSLTLREGSATPQQARTWASARP